jgi:hypothetical protein
MVKSTIISFSNYILPNEDHQSKLISFTLSPSRSPRPSQTHNKTSMAPSKALTVEKIINGFPNPVLPKIDNKPTFEDIQVTTRLLNANANAISVPSVAGGGARGHLGIIMTQVEYAAISASPSVEPYNPNDIPIIPPGTNAMDAAHLARMYVGCHRIYTNRINVDQTLKRLILEAYDNMYTSQLEDYLLQYANRSALEILMHLKQTYGFINPTQLAENYKKMTATKLGLNSADNLLEPSGNNALYQAQQAVQGITQQMMQSTINPLPFLLTAVLSLPWPT